MGTMLGISFDATPISGVVVEFVKLARIFRERGHEVHLDLGYDIKADKEAFFRPYAREARLLPEWVHLARVEGVDRLRGYDPGFAHDVLRDVVANGDGARLLATVDAIAERLSDLIVTAWERLGVSVVVIENGTLPENITYSRALYRAIEAYGTRRSLGRFVLWRDHDLMWQSEPSAGKYGRFPYTATPRLVNSPFIQYVALHDEALRRTLEWVPDLRNIDVLPNTFTHEPAEVGPHNASFRRDHGIPEAVPLIARCTRVIPQKRIDRDIHLLASVAESTDAFLFVAGDAGEAPGEHARLEALARELGVADRVVFGGWLAPSDSDVGRAAGCRYSVRDLLAHASISSFLTARDYESYGNPIGEAIAARVPYVATRYELYDTVYGSKGFRAPLLDPAVSDLPTDALAAEVAELLTDPAKRAEVAGFNHALGRRHLSHDHAERLVDRLLAA